MASTVNPAGFITPFDAWGVHNNLRFFVQQMLSKVQTATIVKVVSCTNDGGVSPFGMVNVEIMVNQINSSGVPTPHVEMYRLPYLRLQGGSNAIILDPQPGDIGIALFASRDITNVVSTQAQANPGSFRMHDFSDGMYLGGLLNGTPLQYIRFSDDGISIVSPSEINETAPSIQMGNGGTLNLLMTEKFFTFWTTNILPFLQSKGYAGPIPPLDSVTTVLEAE